MPSWSPLLATALGARWVPRGRVVRLALLAGLLGAAATGLFLLATHHGLLTVAAVLTSLYPAFTVLLAALVLREHVHRAQASGWRCARSRSPGRGRLTSATPAGSGHHEPR